MVKAIPFNDRAKAENIRKDIEAEPEKFVKKLLSNRFGFGVDDVTRTGIYLERAYKYNLRPFLRKFVYKQYDMWHEMYALNKTNLRKLVYGRIDQIVEIET